ncbi:MAG: hypothetical protein J7K63_03930 [Candidatus Marinimicrobia bacterium]|nr:hypothetical protein [Candidatus Neomarinimicrobiota bacterium]
MNVFVVFLGITIKIPLKKIEKKKKVDEKVSEEKVKTEPMKSDREPDDMKTQEKRSESPEEKEYTGVEAKDTEAESMGIKEKIAFYKPFIRKTLLPQIRRIFSYFHLKIRCLHLVYGNENPAVTGWLEGTVASLKPFMAAKRSSGAVSTCFCYDKKSLDFNVDLYFSMNLYGIVIRLLIIWWHYRKLSSLQRRIKHEPDPGEAS